jgi:hypothetical protein
MKYLALLFVFALSFLSLTEAQATMPLPQPEVRCEDGPCSVSMLVKGCALPEGAKVEVFGYISPNGNMPPNCKDPDTGTYLYGGSDKILVSKKKFFATGTLSARGKIHYCGKTICEITDANIFIQGEPFSVPACEKQIYVERICHNQSCDKGGCRNIDNEFDCSLWKCAPDQ